MFEDISKGMAERGCRTARLQRQRTVKGLTVQFTESEDTNQRSDHTPFTASVKFDDGFCDTGEDEAESSGERLVLVRSHDCLPLDELREAT